MLKPFEALRLYQNGHVLGQLEGELAGLKKDFSLLIEDTANTWSLYLNTLRSPEEIEERKQVLHDGLTEACEKENTGYSYVIVKHLLSFQRIPEKELLEKFQKMVKEVPKVDDHEVSFQRRISSILFMASILTRMETQDFERKVKELSSQIAEQTDVLQQASLVLKRSHLQKKIKRNTSVAKRQEQASKESERIVQGQYFLEKWAEIQIFLQAITYIEELIAANKLNSYTDEATGKIRFTGYTTTAAQTEALLEQDRLATELKQ
jgi:hypothetical protein